MEQPKKPVGRPRVETYLDPEWSKIIIESGRQGKHITDFLIKLGISWDTHYELLKRNKKYSETFKEYNKLCEDWWVNKAYESVSEGQSNKFNQRLFMMIMKNKFRDNWRDEKQLDVTTQGEKIKEDNPIQIEIIRKQVDNGEI
jgi:hypothetical protein